MQTGILKKLTLSILPETYSIHRCNPETAIPEGVFNAPFFSITKTEEELSVVIPETVSLQSNRVDTGWGCLKVHGPLDFSLTGILAFLSGILSEAGQSIFAVSTFDTDYILVKKKNLRLAGQALSDNGCDVIFDHPED